MKQTLSRLPFFVPIKHHSLSRFLSLSHSLVCNCLFSRMVRRIKSTLDKESLWHASSNDLKRKVYGWLWASKILLSLFFFSHEVVQSHDTPSKNIQRPAFDFFLSMVDDTDFLSDVLWRHHLKWPVDFWSIMTLFPGPQLALMNWPLEFSPFF